MESPPKFTKNIPNDIILQICICLPAKSIGRFRCVSKSWNSLLSEPQFIKTHLNRIKNFPNEEHQSIILISDYSTVSGLGYDSVSDTYKVVKVSFDRTADKNDCTDMFVDVYSLRNGTWKRAENFLYDHAVDGGSSGVFVDGYLHWVATRNSDYSAVILAFDLAEEKFREVPTPSYVHDGRVALGGCLCMFPLSVWASNCETDVWVMKEYGVKESWTKFTIFYTKVCGFIPVCILGKEQAVVLKGVEGSKIDGV